MEDFQEYPKMLYLHGDVNTYKIVNSADEEHALGADWIDEPHPAAATAAATAA